jgi:PEP-CTERM motif
MRKSLASGVIGAVLTTLFSSSTLATANTIVVDNLGSINESSVSLPGETMPGSGGAFTYYYEFTLPKPEFVSASMSISGPTSDQIPLNTGSFILADWTNTGSSAPYVPSGATLQDVAISGPAPGGQGAFLGTMTSMGDPEPAGAYFVEITGVSGAGSLQLAVDGNVTAAAPEPSTWALVLLGFAGLGFASYGKRRKGRLSDALA